MLYLLLQPAKTSWHVVEECVYIYHKWACVTLASRPEQKYAWPRNSSQHI